MPTITIRRGPRSGGDAAAKFHADPPSRHVTPDPDHPDTDKPDGEVMWVNATGGRAQLWLPNGARVFDPAPPDTYTDIPHNGLTYKLKPKEELEKVGVKGNYEYSVFCSNVPFSEDGFADGNSPPNYDVP